MSRNQTAPGRFMRPVAALLLVGVGAALLGCGEAATAKVEVPLRTAPANDGEIMALIPPGSAVKVSKCSHGWCQVAWREQKGYALAKNFSVAAPANSTTETGFDSTDQYRQDDNDGSDD